MSEIHKFLFEGMPVRGVLVRLTEAWTEVLRRHAAGSAQAYPLPVQNLLGEMLAAATLMQSNIKFNGTLLLQIMGDGPLKLAVAEVQADFGMRATASVMGTIDADASLGSMVNQRQSGKCAITLDPKEKFPGQKAYQGVVPLSVGAQDIEQLSAVLEDYMRQSEQLETTLVLAADAKMAAGLLIQRLPLEGSGNLGAALSADQAGDTDEDYRRISVLASSLKPEELLTLDVDSLLRRLFWQEGLLRFEPTALDPVPHFSCTCSRARVEKMILGLGSTEAQSILAERGEIEVLCDFCGAQERFDAVDVTQIFQEGPKPPSAAVGPH